MHRPSVMRVGTIIGLIVALSGCSTFHLTQEPFQPKGKKLAVIAGMYAVWHGPEGLTRIARTVRDRALRLASGLKRIGYELTQYLKARDFLAVQGIVTAIAVIVCVASLLIDAIVALVDPRVRF